MITNCRGNPAWLPILQAAIPPRRDPYNILFGSGLAGLRIRGEILSAAKSKGHLILLKGIQCWLANGRRGLGKNSPNNL